VLSHHVVLTGPCASGKTTTARSIAQALPAAVVSKDLLKEALAEPLGIVSDADSLRLSGAVMTLLHSLAIHSPVGLVLEANWNVAVDVPKLCHLPLPIVQVLCHAPPEILRARINARIASGSRHPVHRDVISSDVLAQMLASVDTVPEPLPLDAPLYRLDTSSETDVARVVSWIREQHA
jgi:predicted kinase